jgi:predicted aspartyl protease
MSTTRLLTCDGTPCIDVTVDGGKHLRLAIDTGNSASFLDAKAAESLGLQLQPLEGPSASAHPDLKTATLSRVQIGNANLGNVDVVVGDLSKQIAQGTFPNADGTIAYTAFKDRILQLDYPASTVSVSEPLTAAVTCPPANCGMLSLTPFRENGPKIIASTGFNVNGRSLYAQVDTMYTGTMLIYPSAVNMYGLKKLSRTQQTKHFSFTDGGVDMFEAHVGREGFGRQTLLTDAPIYFAGPKVHLPTAQLEGTIGTGLLAGHTATFDFHDNHFWIS